MAPYARTTRTQAVVLVGSVTVLSAIIKNIGALAMLIPVAFQIARKGGKSPCVFLMPMSFGALLGGIVTLIGTSPNIIVSRVRGEILGEPFRMFDFAPVGLGSRQPGWPFWPSATASQCNTLVMGPGGYSSATTLGSDCRSRSS